MYTCEYRKKNTTFAAHSRITKPFPTMTTQAPFSLQRFLDAQENNYVDVFREIKPFSLHKNTQQNATKIRNKMPQKCAMIW